MWTFISLQLLPLMTLTPPLTPPTHTSSMGSVQIEIIWEILFRNNIRRYLSKADLLKVADFSREPYEVYRHTLLFWDHDSFQTSAVRVMEQLYASKFTMCTKLVPVTTLTICSYFQEHLGNEGKLYIRLRDSILDRCCRITLLHQSRSLTSINP